jgi:hypothetical protein
LGEIQNSNLVDFEFFQTLKTAQKRD